MTEKAERSPERLLPVSRMKSEYVNTEPNTSLLPRLFSFLSPSPSPLPPCTPPQPNRIDPSGQGWGCDNGVELDLVPGTGPDALNKVPLLDPTIFKMRLIHQ